MQFSNGSGPQTWCNKTGSLYAADVMQVTSFFFEPFNVFMPSMSKSDLKENFPGRLLVLQDHPHAVAQSELPRGRVGAAFFTLAVLIC